MQKMVNVTVDLSGDRAVIQGLPDSCFVPHCVHIQGHVNSVGETHRAVGISSKGSNKSGSRRLSLTTRLAVVVSSCVRC